MSAQGYFFFFFLKNLAFSKDLFRQENNFSLDTNSFWNTSTYQIKFYVFFFWKNNYKSSEFIILLKGYIIFWVNAIDCAFLFKKVRLCRTNNISLDYLYWKVYIKLYFLIDSNWSTKKKLFKELRKCCSDLKKAALL